MSKSIFCQTVQNIPETNTKPNNCKYVKLIYTGEGTVVLIGTNNKADAITAEDLKRYL